MSKGNKVESLIKKLQSEVIDDSCRAAERLSELKDSRAIEPLIQVLGRGYNIRYAASSALKKLKDVGIDITEPLIHALKDNNSEVRKEAANLLGDLKDARAIEPLIHADLDEVEVGHALKKLKDIGAIELLIQYLQVEDSLVRRRIVDLMYYFNEDARVVELLIKALQDEDIEVRRNAAKGLEVKDTRAVEPLIKALRDEDSSVRAQAAGSCEYLKDSRVVDPLIKALQDSDESVRANAASALGHLSDRRAVEPLTYVLRDANSWVASCAAKALQRLGDPTAEDSLASSLETWTSNSSVQEDIVEALVKITGKAEWRERKAKLERDAMPVNRTNYERLLFLFTCFVVGAVVQSVSKGDVPYVIIGFFPASLYFLGWYFARFPSFSKEYLAEEVRANPAITRFSLRRYLMEFLIFPAIAIPIAVAIGIGHLIAALWRWAHQQQ